MKINKISKYLCLSLNIFKIALSYRISFIFISVGAVIRLIVFYYFWKSVYQSTASIQGMDFQYMITYVTIAHFVTGIIGMFFIEGSIAGPIRDGTIVRELVYPMNYQVKKLFESIGFMGLKGVISGSIILATGFVFFDILMPVSLTGALMFAVSLFLGLILEASIGFCTGMTAFFTTNIFGMVMSRRMITDFFSGALIPLTLFPAPLLLITKYMPFQATVYIPVSIYLGSIKGQDVFYALLLQLFWVIVLWFAGSKVWSLAVRRLEVHGG